MKTPSLSLLLAMAAMATGAVMARGQEATTEVRTAPESTRAATPVANPERVAPQPPPPEEKPEFHIESTQVKEWDVAEAAEFPDLPPVSGTIQIKVHTVTDPGLPDPPPPMSSTGPVVDAKLAARMARHPAPKTVFFSATVYDHHRTLFRCYPGGEADKAITAWSNIDFNHLRGTAGFEAGDNTGAVRKYFVLMGVGNENTVRKQSALAARGLKYQAPDIPILPDSPPAFVVQSANPDAAVLAIIEDIHALYRAEGDRMAANFQAVEKANEERRAYLLAHPPEPKDVTIHFWKRDSAALAPPPAQP